FSLHAAVRWGADQRKELERLCCYITRPAIANERLKRNRAGDVVLQLKSAFKDGTTHIVMSPLEFMQRLAALVPRPRLHLIRFHGVLASSAKLRSQIIPGSPERATETSSEDAHVQGAPARMSWARRLKRVFNTDIPHSPNGGAPLKTIAAIEEPPVIVKILTYLGLPTRAALPSSSSRFIPDNLRAENRLPTQADGAARSEFERVAPQGIFSAPQPPDTKRVSHQAQKQELTTLAVLRYRS